MHNAHSLAFQDAEKLSILGNQLPMYLLQYIVELLNILKKNMFELVVILKVITKMSETNTPLQSMCSGQTRQNTLHCLNDERFQEVCDS